MSEITYCKAGETPDYQWKEVFDLDTGKKLEDVVEVDTEAGWLIRFKRDSQGRLIPSVGEHPLDRGPPVSERLEGRFEIRDMRAQPQTKEKQMAENKDYRGYIDVTGIDLAAFVRAAYGDSRPQGLGHLHYQPGGLSDDEVAEILARGENDRLNAVSMDYVKGRSIKMHVRRGEGGRLYINPRWYDHSRSELERLLAQFGRGPEVIDKALAEEEAKNAEYDAQRKEDAKKGAALLAAAGGKLPHWDPDRPWAETDLLHAADEHGLAKCDVAAGFFVLNET